jgi:hypothetical protein
VISRRPSIAKSIMVMDPSGPGFKPLAAATPPRPPSRHFPYRIGRQLSAGGRIIGLVSIEAATRQAIRACPWLGESDAGMVELAISLAAQIDHEIEDGDAVSLSVGRLAPHLTTALRALGGAPAERRAIAGAAVPGRLAELRAARARERRAS